MKEQIKILCKELGITWDPTDETPPTSRETVKRRRQQIESSLVCCGRNICRPFAAPDKECICGAIQCLPFQCTPISTNSEVQICVEEYSGMREFVPHETITTTIGGASAHTALPVVSIEDQTSGTTSILSPIKCACENLGRLSEHTEPDESDRGIISEENLQEVSTKKVPSIDDEIGTDRKEKLAEASLASTEDTPPEANLTDKMTATSFPAGVEIIEDPISESSLKNCYNLGTPVNEIISDIISERSLKGTLKERNKTQPLPQSFDVERTVTPEKTEKAKSECACKKDFDHKETQSQDKQDEKDKVVQSEEEGPINSLVLPEFSGHSQPKGFAGKLLDSCNIAPDFCSHMTPKLFESCNILPDFCARHNLDTPNVPENKASTLSTKRDVKTPDDNEKTNSEIDDGKKLCTLDYDLTPEKEEIKLPLELTQFDITQSLPKLSDFKNFDDLLLDDSYQVPERPNITNIYPTWFLKTAEVQTGPSLEDFSLRPPISQTSSPWGVPNINYSDVKEDLSSLESSPSYHAKASSESLLEGKKTEERSTSTDENYEDYTKDNEEDSKPADESMSKKSTEESHVEDKSSGEGNINDNSSTEENDSEGSIPEEKHSKTYEEQLEGDEESSQASTFKDSNAVSVDSDLDSSSDEDMSEYMKELNKKPVLSVTRSVEDRIASVTDKLDKFRQVNEVRTVSPTTTLEESIKKTISHTESLQIMDEPKSIAEFHFIPPTIDHSETDTSCFPAWMGKRKTNRDKAIGKTVATGDAGQKQHHGMAVKHSDNAMDPSANKRNIKFSHTVLTED